MSLAKRDNGKPYLEVILPANFELSGGNFLEFEKFLFPYNFYNNCGNSRALIALFLSSISGQTHKFIIYAMRQQARAI